MKNSPNAYALLAVLVPLALGLGLIYLTIMGGIDQTSALIAILASAMLIPLVAILADLARKDGSSRRTRRRRRSSHFPL
jgi:high-affinity Fe2+/Pb2+ permease